MVKRLWVIHCGSLLHDSPQPHTNQRIYGIILEMDSIEENNGKLGKQAGDG